jgi:hypothetical protein
MNQKWNHIIGIHGPQTDFYVWHSLGLPSGQSDLLLRGDKVVMVKDRSGNLIKSILLTRLDTFRFWDLTEENVWRLVRFEIGWNTDKPITDENIEYINIALSRAISYLNDKWYPIPRNIPTNFWWEKDIFDWIKNQRKSKDWFVSRNVCRFLQVVNAYHSLLSIPWVTINKQGDIDLRDKELMNRIIQFFGINWFKYKKNDWSDKFSQTNTSAVWSLIISKNWDWNISFSANFRLKDEKRGVQKFIQNPEYDVKAIIKDMHGLRIEIAEPAHAFKMMEFILKWMGVPTGGIEIKNRNMASNDDWQKWCQKWHFSDEFMTLINQTAKFWSLTKSASKERRELKFSCGNPSFEVQFVLVGNNNDSSYADHDLYVAVCDVFEKIRLDGYCNTEDIENFLDINILDTTLARTGLTREKIKGYIFSKLIPIQYPWTKSKKMFTTVSSVFRIAMWELAEVRECILEFPSKSDYFSPQKTYGIYAWKKVLVKDLKFTSELMALIDDEIHEYGTLREETKVIDVSLSTPSSSSQTPSQDQ